MQQLRKQLKRSSAAGNDRPINHLTDCHQVPHMSSFTLFFRAIGTQLKPQLRRQQNRSSAVGDDSLINLVITHLIYCYLPCSSGRRGRRQRQQLRRQQERSSASGSGKLRPQLPKRTKLRQPRRSRNKRQHASAIRCPTCSRVERVAIVLPAVSWAGVRPHDLQLEHSTLIPDRRP